MNLPFRFSTEELVAMIDKLQAVKMEVEAFEKYIGDRAGDPEK